MRQICSDDGLNALILPTGRHDKLDVSFVQACTRTTDFCFPSVVEQFEEGHGSRIKNRGEEEGAGGRRGGELETTKKKIGNNVMHGDVLVTRHSNLCGLQLVFHLSRDVEKEINVVDENDEDDDHEDDDHDRNHRDHNEIEDGAESDGDAMDTSLNGSLHGSLNLSAAASGRGEQLASSVRAALSSSVRRIIKMAALSGASILYVPYDLYSPLDAGFGTRDFVTLVRDTRATMMELISSQRQHAHKQQLKCVRFVMSQHRSNDEALSSSLVSVLKEQFASDIFRED